MQVHHHPNGAAIEASLASWADAAQREDRGESLTERQRQEIALRLNSPKRPGAIDAKDAGHLPLFIAGNEPSLF